MEKDSSATKTLKARPKWKNGLEFLFSCIGVVVGLGNIWRFPYICYKNGGGAFLIPYFLFLFLIAIPQLLLQFSYPQYSSLGPAKAWVCCPLFKGIGFAMVVTIGIVCVYYNVIIAWTLYYFVSCFTATLPWSHCNNEWNSETCYSRTSNTGNMATNNSMMTLSGNVATNHSLVALSGNVATNHSRVAWSANVATKNSLTTLDTSDLERTMTNQTFFTLGAAKTATEEFWQYRVLELTDSIEDMGVIRWPLLLCNLAVCVVLFMCVFKGIQLSGKIMYVAATIPYIFLTILLVKGLTLEGAWRGLHYFFVPRWEELLKLSVWSDAAIQVLYSMGFATADLIVLASHNPFHHNLFRDAMILPFIDAFTSLFSGCVIFVTLGYMSTTFNVDIQNVVADGPGIAFIIFPEALSTLPIPQFWSSIFFLTLFTVGLDSRIVHIQLFTGVFSDLYPHIFRSKVAFTAFGACMVPFVIGIPFVFQGGMYVLQMVDWYVASVAVLLVILLESSVMAWVYGAERLRKDISLMVGFTISRIWLLFWKFITPVCLLGVWVFSLLKHRPVTYGGKSYPVWSIGVGWVIALVPLMPLLINMIYTLAQHKGNLLQRLRESIKPLPEWYQNQQMDENIDDCDKELML